MRAAAAYADRRAVRGLARGGSRTSRRMARQDKAWPSSTPAGVPDIARCERQVAKHASANERALNLGTLVWSSNCGAPKVSYS
jgi:hypothetical protein